MEDCMNDKTKRSKQLNIRLSQEDLMLLENQRSTLQMTQVKFISHIINNGINEIIEISSPMLRKDIAAIERLFYGIGDNLNQIAAALNSSRTPDQNILNILSNLDKNMTILIKMLEQLKKEKITTKGRS